MIPSGILIADLSRYWIQNYENDIGLNYFNIQRSDTVERLIKEKACKAHSNIMK